MNTIFRTGYRNCLATLTLLLLCLFGNGSLLAQDEVLIFNGEVTTCGGVFLDDGGVGSYTAGNDYVFTICPDNPGDVIQVAFSAFALYTSPNPNNSDYLSIFDGDDQSAPSLGDYTGNSLQGLPVTGTVNNTTGCLTFVFSSNPNGTGLFPGWEAAISCETPCDPPTAASTIISPEPQPGPPQTVGVCTNQPVTFSDAGSQAAPGFTLANYIWNFGDNTTIEGPDTEVTHSFTEPGEYLVTLTVEDNNGCTNLNIVPMQVLVSTTPIFNSELPSEICVGETAVIDGSGIENVTWTALPPQVVSGQTYLADGAGFSYSSPITFDFFEPDATLETCGDLEGVFVNMEHSYVGDLGITISCPDGTTVNILEWPNGGGGTYLGETVDDGVGDSLDQAGIGFTYEWVPGAANGNIDVNGEPLSYVTTNGVPVNATVTPAGEYQSDQDLCDLVGCPLNGTWTFSVADNLGADNGWIFFWGINFNPTLFPDVTTFTPVTGLGADSSGWAGDFIIDQSEDNNIITVQPPSAGQYSYVFSATNNFGCSFDTTVVLNVVDPPQADAGPDVVVCNEPAQLEGGVEGLEPGSCSDDAGFYSECLFAGESVTYTICPDDPGDGTLMTVTFLEGTIGFFGGITIYDSNNFTNYLDDLFGDYPTTTFTASNSTGCLTISINQDFFDGCDGGVLPPVDFEVGCTTAGTQNIIYSWTPEDGLSDPTIANPTADVTQTTVYTLTVTRSDNPACISTDQVTVAVDASADPGISTDTTICFNTVQQPLTDFLLGTPATSGIWLDEDSNTVASIFNPLDYPNGGTFSFIYEVSNGVCTNYADLSITVLPAGDETCCLTTPDAGEDVVVCGMEQVLDAGPVAGFGKWSGPDYVSFSDEFDPQATATASEPGVAILYWTDSNGFQCIDSSSVEVVFSEPMEVNVTGLPTNCFGECSGRALATVVGGITAGDYDYTWPESGISAAGLPAIRDSLCIGQYWVVAEDDYGCADSAYFVIDQPAPIAAEITTEAPLCGGECTGTIAVASADAVLYSYDGGENFTSLSSASGICAGLYEVIIENAQGCQRSYDITLEDTPEIVAAFEINPLPATQNDGNITLTNTSFPQPITDVMWTIHLGNGPVEFETYSVEYAFPTDTPGTYLIDLVVANENGCSDTISKTAIIQPNLSFYIPNTFTPNGDGINDLWRPIVGAVDFEEYSLEIFNRWGERVFSTGEPGAAWNGSFRNNGYAVPDGVYVYIIRALSATDREKRTIEGIITVVR